METEWEIIMNVNHQIMAALVKIVRHLKDVLKTKSYEEDIFIYHTGVYVFFEVKIDELRHLSMMTDGLGAWPNISVYSKNDPDASP